MDDGLGTWSWSIRANCPRGWRQRLAQQLHRLAVRIDGRWSVAIEIKSQPSVSADRQAVIILAGLKHAQQLLDDECCAGAVECALRAHRPDLYADRHG